jgi:hypothetical protein
MLAKSMTKCKLSIKVVVVVIMTVNELGRRGTDKPRCE